MKNLIRMLPLLVAMILQLTAKADVDVRTSDYYDATVTAQGKLHFKIPIITRNTRSFSDMPGFGHFDGFYMDFRTYATEGCYLYRQAGDGVTAPFLTYHSAGDGRVTIRLSEGSVVVTNATDGDTAINHGSEDFTIPFLGTYLEFDWFPSEELLSTQLTVGAHVVWLIEMWSEDTVTYSDAGTEDFNLVTVNNLRSADVQPQLIDPIFYAQDNANIGKVAIPYVAFQQPYKYYNSWSSVQKPCQEQSGMFYVKAEDTVRPGYRIYMQVRSSESTDSTEIIRWLSSNKVHIPAYHKLYDFTVRPYQYQRGGLWYMDNRYKQLTWKLHYPHDEDIVPTDMIEIQRAYRSDYSDAQTIAMLPIEWSDSIVNEVTYTYVDSTREAWYNPVDDSNNVYYRLRRTSSAVWGWEGHDYAKSSSNMSSQTPYMLRFGNEENANSYQIDENFADNNKVQLTITFTNSNYGNGSQSDPRNPHYYWDDRATLYIYKILQETGDSIRLPISSDSIKAAFDRCLYHPVYDTFYHGNVTVRYTDVANSPCIHYKYELGVERGDATLKPRAGYSEGYDSRLTMAQIGDAPYYTNASNLESLTGTHEENPEYVRLTWDISDGGVDEFVVEARPANNSSAAWIELGTTLGSFWMDRDADPEISPEWQYRVTMRYTCEGNTVSRSRLTTGSRSPYGRISGRVRYENGTGCPGVTVTATRTDNGTTVQVVTTDSTGAYLFDSLPYGGGVEYAITPTSQTAEFTYNNATPALATVTLSLHRCITQGVDFDNVSSVRFSGRVLFENSSVPVRDANLKLNGILMRYASAPVKTDASGNFEVQVPRGSAFTLQVVKDGHHFVGDGFVRIDGDSLLTLSTPLDGVRVWDQTKVRLTGRVCGGLDQTALPLGLGLSHNNLGDDLKLVLELEGDNVSYIVRVPSDLTKDTLEYNVPHIRQWASDGTVWRTDTVGSNNVHYQQKRIVVEADPVTGEFCADLFPVRYKVTQASATGYATLFSRGRTGELLDLSGAATRHDTIYDGAMGPDGFTGRFASANAQYKLTYRSPISITCKQLRWGMEVDYFGEASMRRQSITNESIEVPLAIKQSDGTYRYLFGAPVFKSGNYDFRAYAHEDYYYNNDPNGRHDEVRIKGGTLKIYNGMHENEQANTQVMVKELDTLGSATFTVPVDYVSFVRSDTSVQRVLDLSVESEGEYVEHQAVMGYITGHRTTDADAVTSTHGTIQLLDVLRDPPGSASSAYIESGAEYSYNYTFDFSFKFGVELDIVYGSQIKSVVGAWAGMGGGVFSGQSIDFSSTHEFSIPITSSIYKEHEGGYTFKTSERISTSSDPYYVGQDADVYIGVVQNVYFRRSDAVQPLDSVTFTALGGSSANGTLQTVVTGVDTNGKRYYLVIGSELEIGPYLDATFAYTHSHIRDNIIPQLMNQRDALLLTCDRTTAQAIANAQNKQVYWSRVAPGDADWGGKYEPIPPVRSSETYSDEVASLNHRIADWIKLLLQNEAEKVAAIHSNQHDTLGIYSVNGPLSLSRSYSYSYSNVYHSLFDLPGISVDIGEFLLGMSNPIQDVISESLDNAKTSITDRDARDEARRNIDNVSVSNPGSTTSFLLAPILDLDLGRDPEKGSSHIREIGFTLTPDEYSNMDVSIYRLKTSDSGFAFNDSSAATRKFVSGGKDYNGNDYLYGSLVYYLRSGATKCPCEVADSTEYYRPKMPLSGGSLRLENPKVDIDVHERSNVPVDRPAIFTIRLYNELESTVGAAMESPISFKLKMSDVSNLHGARVMIDGMPLTDGRTIILTGNEVITKTLEVYAGDGYDFEDLVIQLFSTCNSSTMGEAQFSVHFMPVSCDVSLDLVHDNWVLNTLSPHDSTGYYLPVGITDFDVNYRNFDHIEFQYKLSTASADEWVTLCSYYADRTLYAAASGTKEMIVNGRIENIHFYGERDPIEQHYDLRAVSFCRHGSGFITKSSPVLSGIKDTRCPRVFGQPEPAYGILGVADNIKLRFNEPIAGNYLDEDNNFQILGVTNSSGRISSSTSLYFDGTPSCGASSAVTRVLADKSFSIDLMVKPYTPVPSDSMELFGYNTHNGGIAFGLEPDGDSCRMYLNINEVSVRSLPLEPLTDFRRLTVVVDRDEGMAHFYAGTEEVTDFTVIDSTINSQLATLNTQSAPLVFGHGFHGNILETRLWLKALSQADIVATHERRLTGYERKLGAYYPMNEGRGDICADKASGSTLSLEGFAWTTPDGYALHLDGTQAVSLDQDILSRSAIQDYTLMFWFRTSEQDVPIFSAGWRQRGYQGVDGYDGTLIAIENGHLCFRNGNMLQQAAGSFADGEWHHYVLTVNRTQNNAAVYVDGNLMNTFATDTLSGLSGDMMLGGAYGRPVLNGSIDELAVFEQALPKTLVDAYDNLAPCGDEMGLVGWLPFSEQVENDNGIMEEHFSVNNRRIFKTSDGTVVEKIQPLTIAPGFDTLSVMFATNEDLAPVRERALLTKINFDWGFNNDELLIDIKMEDREINKNSLFLTVRNVEDLNGNRTVSPTMWQVYVNKNVLLWSENRLVASFISDFISQFELNVDIQNISGHRHQYTIDGLPDWLTVSQTYGSIDPQETLGVTFTIDSDLPVGIYSEIVYLTDENGLSEPLRVMVEIKGNCPWYDENSHGYERQMSLRGQVVVNGVYDTDMEDVVAAMIGNEVVGLAKVDYNAEVGSSFLYLTIHGNTEIVGQPLQFRLWQASTDRVFSLTPSVHVLYGNDTTIGLPPAQPVILFTSVVEVQNLDIQPGWNWISFYLKPDANASIDGQIYSSIFWDEGDQLKSVATQRFAEWDGTQWTGSLSKLSHKQMYMMRVNGYHRNTQLAGHRLIRDADRTISLNHGWNVFPYLLNTTENLTNALADYIENVSVGDIVKSQSAFAIYSENERWEGSLKMLTPGQGYLLKRQGEGSVDFTFRSNRVKSTKGAEHQDCSEEAVGRWRTTMTVIARTAEPADRVLAYVDGRLVGVAENTDSLFFISLGTDLTGMVTFAVERGDEVLWTTSPLLASSPNAHHGTVENPILLAPAEGSVVRAYPTVFADHVTFCTDGAAVGDIGEGFSVKLYSATGALVGQWTTSSSSLVTPDLHYLPIGAYFATVKTATTTNTIKLIKK